MKVIPMPPDEDDFTFKQEEFYKLYDTLFQARSILDNGPPSKNKLDVYREQVKKAFKLFNEAMRQQS